MVGWEAYGSVEVSFEHNAVKTGNVPSVPCFPCSPAAAAYPLVLEPPVILGISDGQVCCPLDADSQRDIQRVTSSVNVPLVIDSTVSTRPTSYRKTAQP